MSKIISWILSLVTIFSSSFGLGWNVNKTVVPQKQVDEFEPVVRFFVCSDTHISSATDFKLDRIKKAIELSYAEAEAHKSYKNLDAVVFCGDLTDSGQDEQFKAFESTVKESVKDETKILAVVAKAHDSTGNGKKSLQYCSEITGLDSDFNTVINGFHFIGISTSEYENMNHSTGQKSWLKNQLNAAKKEDDEKPIFVFQHEHIAGTVYGSSTFEGWGTTDFRSTIAGFSQVVDFSGHSHYPLNDPRSVWQGSYTAVGTGSMNYMEFTVDTDRTVHTDDGGNAAQGWIVEVDGNNRIRLHGLDVITGQWLCDYLIENPTDFSTYAYTPYNQQALSSAPSFDKDSSLQVAQEEGKYVVTAPAAGSTDGKIVFLYRIKVMNASGIVVHSEYKLNNYWTANQYESVSFTVEAKPGYEVSVTAENAYGMQSEALSAKI